MKTYIMIKLRIYYKEFLIRTKKKLSTDRKFLICNDGIFNPLKVKQI